jgi:hypothetical protein
MNSMPGKMKIMVFLHGTTIMHRNASGRTREERVQQVREREESVRDYASYVPVDDAVSKVRTWSEQGAEIVYLSSHRRPEYVEMDRAVLRTCGFPAGQIVFRQPGEGYQDVAERVLPDVLIEDDCESIGGSREMTSAHLKPELQAKITAIVIKEFGGINHLPDDITALKDH